ncbi:MAG TPA: hypothetical protein VKQ36_01290, partial [Ktedonobacterales bacterium]|nr:hypothetical protein [Ktedonobacterales bacterium]
ALGRTPCPNCGYEMSLHFDMSRSPDIPPGLRGEGPGVYHWCPRCDHHFWESLQGLLLATPAGQRFMRRYPRLRTLPYEQVEALGRPVIMARFESAVSQDRLTLLADAKTFELLRAYGDVGKQNDATVATGEGHPSAD